MVRYNLKKLKQILCKGCGLKGHCAKDVKCNDVRNIEASLHQIADGNCKCYIGKYDGKKGEIEIIVSKKPS